MVVLGPVMLLKLGDTGTMMPGRECFPAAKHFSRMVVGGVPSHELREVLGHLAIRVRVRVRLSTWPLLSHTAPS